METPETRAKLANAIQTLRSQGREAEVQQLVDAYKIKYKSGQQETQPQNELQIPRVGWGNIPVVKQLSDIGTGIGATIGKTVVGTAQLPFRVASGLGKLVGADTQYADKYVEALSNLKQNFYEKPFQEQLGTASGQVGTAIGTVAPYLTGAGVVNRATASLSTVPRVLSRAATDVAISQAQTGGDLATAGATGVASAIGDVLLGGKAKAVRGVLSALKQVGKTTASGYVSDVASGVAGLRGEDRTGAKAFIPGAGTVLAGGFGTALTGVQGIKNIKDPVQKVNKIIANREKELQKLEDSYQAVRKVTNKTKSQGIDPKKILAETDLLNGAVDNTGTLRTQNASIELNDFIRPQEKVISDTLYREGVLVELSDVRSKLLKMVDDSGIKGGAKLRAIKNVEDDIAGLMLEADSTGKVLLSTIHDAKIDKYANIDFSNPESKRVDKAIAKGLKEIVESNTRSVDVKNLNRELQQHYAVLDLLEKLDGKKVEGGRLGKYFAQTVGGIVGSHFGPLGAIIGAEAGSGLKGVQMSSKFGGKTGIPLKQSEEMQRAVSQSKLPRLGLPQPRSNVRSTVSSGATIPLRNTTRLPDEAQAMSANPSYSSNNLGNRNTNQSTAIIPTRIGISKSIAIPKGSSIDQTRKIVNNHLESTLQAISDTPTFDMIQANPQAFYRQQIQDIAMGLKASSPKYARLANSIASIDASKIDSFETLASKIREKLNAKTFIETITGKGIPNRQGGFISTATPYKESGNITTKLLKDLEGKTTVSKQYILDATNRGDIKQVEKDLFRALVANEGNTINVSDFAKKVKRELLPLKTVNQKVTVSQAKTKLKNMGYTIEREMDGGASILDKNGDFVDYDEMTPEAKKLVDSVFGTAETYEQIGSNKYENITLPDELRGNVKNYKENVYESPIKTSAGSVHFSGLTDNYFGHTRIEDMADNKTRRVIEVQSDLYQKGGLEKELSVSKKTPMNIAVRDLSQAKQNEYYDAIDKLQFGNETEKATARKVVEKLTEEADSLRKAQSPEKLAQYNDPTAHFRMIREEIKKAAQDGKTKLQFPTGETAMKIEGLGDNSNWHFTDREGYPTIKVTLDKLKVGKQVMDNRQGQQGSWIITDVLGDGKFKAVQKIHFNEYQTKLKTLSKRAKESGGLQRLNNEYTETFDISGKVDTNNPIYKFYEKDVQKYLNRFGGKRVIDDNGVSWIEVPITKEQSKAPVEAFGKTKINPLIAVAGISALGIAGKNIYEDKKKRALPKQRK